MHVRKKQSDFKCVDVPVNAWDENGEYEIVDEKKQ